jgi:glycosyltransferase involved in cell wall biosynthesis
VVITVHDATDLTMPDLYPASWRLLHAVWGVPAVRRAAAIIVPSAAARLEVARAYRIAPERVWVTHEGVDARFRPMVAPDATLARYGLRRPYVLFVGTAGPRKNLDRLLEAFARTCRASPAIDQQLVLAGPRPGLARRLGERARSLGVADRLVFPGWIEEQDLPAVYAGARCLCYASLAEGFGLPIVEAMACGIPVLTSNCSSMPEVAGDAALLVDPLSVDAIAGGLTRLLTDEPLRRDLVARGLARARGLTWDGTAMATARVYRAAAEGRPVAGTS